MAIVYQCAGRKRKVCDFESEKKWVGRCPNCSRFYDIIVKGNADDEPSKNSLAAIGTQAPKRFSSGLIPFDHVAGNPPGLAPGGSYVISGPPGGGKSTLLLQTACSVADKVGPVAYASGEQSKEDIGEMAGRIGALSENVEVLGNNGDVYAICERAEELKAKLLIVDSIQTASLEDVDAAEGSSHQIKESSSYLTAWAKREKCALIIVSQITKEGDVAGPKFFEHVVDCLLELDPFERYNDDGELDEKTKNWKMLSSGKNRFGPSGVSEMFELTDKGMVAVAKKSRLILV